MGTITSNVRQDRVPFSFDFKPGTVFGPHVPRGYKPLLRRSVVGTAAQFDILGQDVLNWGIQRGSSILVIDDRGRFAPPVFEGFEGFVTVPVIRHGAAALTIRAPMRVYKVIDTPETTGFAYGTLPGHPERGEEAFLLRRMTHESVLEIRALSRPAMPYALAPLLGRALQAQFTRRYLHESLLRH